MRTIRELRTTLNVKPHQINSLVKFFINEPIDYDIWLESKGMNLQREFVWNLDQRRELVWSVFIGRRIPRMAMICTHGEVYQVIDGKQRLSALLDFYNDKFTLLVDGKEYLCSELPLEYQQVFGAYAFPYYIHHEDNEGDVSDQDKIDWFMFINYAGTPQDVAHMARLNKSLRMRGYKGTEGHNNGS